MKDQLEKMMERFKNPKSFRQRAKRINKENPEGQRQIDHFTGKRISGGNG